MNDNEKRLAGYRRLIDIARDLASTLDLDILLNRIVSAASDLTETEAASILLYDDAARQLYFQVATNLDQPTMRGLAVPLEGSIAGWIVINHKAARITNAKEDPRHFSIIEKQTHVTTRSLLGVPLITKDKVVGVLEVLGCHLAHIALRRHRIRAGVRAGRHETGVDLAGVAGIERQVRRARDGRHQNVAHEPLGTP